MANSTTEYWSANGVSLQTYAQNISTWGGDKESPPRLRGDDVLIPYRPGRKSVERMADSRVIGLEGWILGADVDGVPGVEDDLRKNWRALRKLLWNNGKSFPLTKRWWDADAAVMRTATATAVFHNDLEPRMTGPRRAEFSVDLFLADPFFYGTEETIELTVDTVLPNPGPTAVVTILGDATTRAVNLDLVGPLTDARVTITDMDPQVYVRYLALLDGYTATLDVSNFRSVETDDVLVDTFTIGTVRHDGDPFWLPLEPGDHTIVLSVTAGTGTVTLRYQPAWL